MNVDDKIIQERKPNKRNNQQSLPEDCLKVDKASLKVKMRIFTHKKSWISSTISKAKDMLN